jgi:antitoxin MazE
MKARLVRIGNSRGIRLPKPLLVEAQLSDEIEIAVRDRTIVISSATRPRAGWSEAAKRARARDDDKLLDPPTSTKFDDAEWKW